MESGGLRRFRKWARVEVKCILEFSCNVIILHINILGWHIKFKIVMNSGIIKKEFILDVVGIKDYIYLLMVVRDKYLLIHYKHKI